MAEEEQILVELSSLDGLLVPLSRSARLKYTCMSVSTRFVALGSNTAGIYLFSRETCQLLQVVFAEKETSPVVMVSLSPNDRYVAMVVSSGSLHVIDLKLDSRARPETIRSVSDDWSNTITCLHWDSTSTRLYVGDDMGKVHLMPVHSFKAKNLFSPPEVIMKLDSSVVQIDKADDKILVSTMTRCYLCDTNREQYSQIGKKLRDGQYGACFLRQGSSALTIYCARPGSRIWEVDCEGNVMNTHQFKQLLAIPSLPVVKIKEELELPNMEGQYDSQSISFPCLKVISGCYILTWTSSCLYIIDPVNVKVILWSKPFTGIQDVCCIRNEIFIFLPSMQVHHLTLLPVTRVVSLYLKSEEFINAASLCISFENTFCRRRKREQLGINDLKSLYDKIIKMKALDTAEKLHTAIVNIEQKLQTLSDSESSGSGTSRTNSFVEREKPGTSSNHKIENYPIASLENSSVRNLETDRMSKIDHSVNAIDLKQNSVLPVTEQKDFNVSMNSKTTDNSSVTTSENIINDTGQTKEECIDTSGKLGNVATSLKNALGSHLISETVNKDDLKTDKLVPESAGYDMNNTSEKVNIQMNVSQTQNIEQNNFTDISSDHKASCIPIGSGDTSKIQIVENGPLSSDIIQSNEDQVVLDERVLASPIKMDSVNIDNVATVKESEQNAKTIDIKENEQQTKSSVIKESEQNTKTNDIKENEQRTESSVIKESEQQTKSIVDTESEQNTKASYIKASEQRTEASVIKDKEGNHTEIVITPAFDVDNSKTRSDDNSLKLDVSPEEFVERPLSPVPLITLMKQELEDDIIEDDLDLQSKSSNMGSRKTSLTSLSSLSSAEVYMESIPGNFPATEEIAVSVKRKSSKRRHRKSVDDAVKLKHKGDFVVSPSGSLDHTIEEDCFSVSSRGSDKTGQEKVSQSDNSSIAEDRHARSLPNVVELENCDHIKIVQNVEPVSDANRDPISIREPDSGESPLSLSAEFSRSAEYGRSGESTPSESPLLHSYDGAREGIAASPKTTFLNLRDRVQKNLKSQTKKVITNIKDKNLLTRAKVFLSQPGEQHKSDVFMQPHGQDRFSNVRTGQDEVYPDETDSLPQSPVDISALQEITAETQKKLQDPYILLQPDKVCKILLDWVTVLNQTFHKLHIVKYTQSNLSHGEAVSDSDQVDKRDNQSDSVSNPSMLSGPENVINAENNDVKRDLKLEQDISELSFDTKTASSVNNQAKADLNQNKETVMGKSREPGASILKDKDFCYTKDPLFLPSDVFSDVSELAQACFDICCHGNILLYRNLQSDQNPCKIETDTKLTKVSDDTEKAVCDNLKLAQLTVTEKFDSAKGESVECEDRYDKEDTLCAKEICDKLIECSVSSTHQSVGDNSNARDQALFHDGPMSGDSRKPFTDVSDKQENSSSDKEISTNSDKEISIISETEIGSNCDKDISINSENEISSNFDKEISNNTDKEVSSNTDKEMSSNINKEKSNNSNNETSDMSSLSVSVDDSSSLQDNLQNTHNVLSYNHTNVGAKVEITQDEVTKEVHETPITSNSCCCNQDDKEEHWDEEMAFFVRCYFMYLSAVRIRRKTVEYGNCFYQTWCALVSCLQELACDDSERYGVDKGALLQHMVDSLSPGEDGVILLGHISRLFSAKFNGLVSACVRCHPYIQPLDVLFMCSLHDVAIDTVFKPYMQQMIQDAIRTHRKDTISGLYSHSVVRKAWLDILLSEEGNLQELVDTAGNPCAMSHTHIWKHQPGIEDIIKQATAKEDRSMVLDLCSKYGYWNGCLKILRDTEDTARLIKLILHLDDVRLFTNRTPVGYLPGNLEDWKKVLHTYKDFSSDSCTGAGSQVDVIDNPDWSERITWDSLANLLVKHLGPDQAVSLLQEYDVPETCLSPSFYQTCAMAGLVHKHQRLILHSMLEKIDTYLWAQRPVYASPQLHYIILKEKELLGKGSNSMQHDTLQQLIQQEKSESHGTRRQFAEDPECHWGVEAKINLLCPCCNIPLKEPVSHIEPGVLLFKCGHGYHRMCLPERECFLCSQETEENTFI